tara:strand:+ start:258 stop:566 length:309 start_codon:yes stop_codon:yes gene_type:complete
MLKYLKITTEVNKEEITIHRKIFLEYDEEETHNHLEYQTYRILSKILKVPTSKLEEGRNFMWHYEDYNDEKHKDLDCVDLNELHETRFYNDFINEARIETAI